MLPPGNNISGCMYCSVNISTCCVGSLRKEPPALRTRASIMEGDVGAGNAAPSTDPSPIAQVVADIVPEALREDQIQNAVAFLSHPKVRGSAVTAKRSFLEKKGLTASEIEEAFKRVPETPSVHAGAATTPATTSTPTYAANNLVTYTQQQDPAAGQPAVLPAAAVQPSASGPGAGALVPMHPQTQMQPMQGLQQPIRWTQVVLGAGIAAAGIYGIHQLIAPRVSGWVTHVRTSRAAAAEAEAQRIAALTAALESLAAGQARLQDTLNSLQATMDKQQQQQQGDERYKMAVEPGRGGYGSEVACSSYSEYLRCQSPAAAAEHQRDQQQQYSYTNASTYDASRVAAVRGWDAYDASRSPQSTAAGPAISSRSPAANGYGPPGGFEVMPRSLAPLAAGTADSYSRSSAPVAAASDDVGGLMGRGAVSAQGQQQQQQQQQQQGVGRPDEAPHSAAFQEVMEMVRAGITPPNVRTDINDTPPDPSRPISAPHLQPRGKPWERGSISSNAPDTEVHSTPPKATVAGDTVPQQQQQQQQQISSNWPSSSQQAALSATGTSLVTDMEAAAGAKRKSNAAAAGYDLSHLLGPGSSTNHAPWRPPPPPAPTVTAARPTSSCSSSSRTAAPAAALVPDLQESTSDNISNGAAASQAEQLVAIMAADAVKNVVAGADVQPTNAIMDS